MDSWDLDIWLLVNGIWIVLNGFMDNWIMDMDNSDWMGLLHGLKNLALAKWFFYAELLWKDMMNKWVSSKSIMAHQGKRKENSKKKLNPKTKSKPKT